MDQGQHQPAPNQAPMQQPRINFGMILPMQLGLEQFLAETYRGQVFKASVQQM